MLEAATRPTAQKTGLQQHFYLDALRTSAMCFVILSHCMSPYITNLEIYGSTSWYSFIFANALVRSAVPIFLMISGFLILKSSKTLEIGASYKSRLPRLLIPLLFWNVAYFFFDAWFFGDSLHPLRLFGAILDHGAQYHMWFIYMLIGIYLLAPFLARIVRASSLKELTVLFFVIISMSTIRPFINTVTPVYIFLFSPLMDGYLGFFLLGYILASAELGRRARGLLYLGGILGLAISIIGNLSASSAEGVELIFNLGHTLPRFLVSSALFVAAKEAFKNVRGKGLLCRAVCALSKISYGVFWIHVMVLLLCTQFVAVDLSPLALVALRFVLTLSVSSAIIFPLSKIKFIKNLLM